MLQHQTWFEYPTRPRRAFTLIELLIVVATIAILTALLLPILIHANAAACQARCASNLEQLGRAFQLYAQDWAGYWPCPGGLYGDRGYWSQSGLGGINGYVRQKGIGTVWCCPLLKEWSGQFPPRSYSMNSYLRTPADVEYPTVVEYPFCLGYLCGIQVNRIMEPTRTILLFEGVPLTNGWEDRLDYLYRCANWTRVRGYWDGWPNTIHPGQPWHGDRNNYLIADGHIVARAPGRKTTAVLSTYEEMYQWYVDKARFRIRFAQYAP